MGTVEELANNMEANLKRKLDGCLYYSLVLDERAALIVKLKAHNLQNKTTVGVDISYSRKTILRIYQRNV